MQHNYINCSLFYCAFKLIGSLFGLVCPDCFDPSNKWQKLVLLTYLKQPYICLCCVFLLNLPTFIHDNIYIKNIVLNYTLLCHSKLLFSFSSFVLLGRVQLDLRVAAKGSFGTPNRTQKP